MKQIKKLITLVDAAQKQNNDNRIQTEAERHEAIKEIGNILHDSVPVSNDEVSVSICKAAASTENPVVAVYVYVGQFLGTRSMNDSFVCWMKQQGAT